MHLAEFVCDMFTLVNYWKVGCVPGHVVDRSCHAARATMPLHQGHGHTL